MLDANLRNAKKRFDLLGSVLKNPKLLSKPIINGCRSQGALAKLQLDESEISRVSLNTLKSSAKRAIETQNGVDGWQQLDQRRNLVNHLVNELETAKGKKFKATDKAKINELEESINKAIRERLRILKGYYDLLKMFRVVAKGDKALEAKLNRHLKSFSIQGLLTIEGKRPEND